MQNTNKPAKPITTLPPIVQPVSKFKPLTKIGQQIREKEVLNTDKYNKVNTSHNSEQIEELHEEESETIEQIEANPNYDLFTRLEKIGKKTGNFLGTFKPIEKTEEQQEADRKKRWEFMSSMYCK